MDLEKNRTGTEMLFFHLADVHLLRSYMLCIGHMVMSY